MRGTDTSFPLDGDEQPETTQQTGEAQVNRHLLMENGLWIDENSGGGFTLWQKTESGAIPIASSTHAGPLWAEYRKLITERLFRPTPQALLFWHGLGVSLGSVGPLPQAKPEEYTIPSNKISPEAEELGRKYQETFGRSVISL